MWAKDIMTKLLRRHIFKRVNIEFIGYFLTSLIALAADISVFSFCIRTLNTSWFASALVGFMTGVSITYFLSVFFVFSGRNSKDMPVREFLIFMTIGVIGLGITQVILFLGIEWLNLQAELVKLFSAGITFLYNFIARKILLFTKK